MDEQIFQGTTSKRILIFIQSSIAVDGSGLTGLTNASGGLTCYYAREDDGNVGGTVVNLVSATLGTYTSSGFIQKDATNMPGWYEFDPPNAALASGAQWVVFHFQGATNMVPCPVRIQLVAYNPNSATVTVGTNNDKTGYSLLAGQLFIKKNTALSNFEFLMVASTDHVTPKTGLTITAQRSIDGGAFASCANSASELSAGIYVINLANTDLNGTVITFKFTGTGADARYLTVVTQA